MECPNCGGDAELRIWQERDGYEGYIKCESCGTVRACKGDAFDGVYDRITNDDKQNQRGSKQ